MMMRTTNIRKLLAFCMGLLFSAVALSGSTTLTIGDAAVTAGASATTLNFPVTRTTDTGYDVYLGYHTEDGSATAGTHYTGITAGRIKLDAGSSMVNIPVTVAAQGANTGSKTLNLILDNATGVGPAASFPNTSTNFGTGSVPLSVAFGDVNGDGKPDLAVANNGSSNVSVLLNTTAAGVTADGVPKGIEVLARKWDEPTAIGIAYDYDYEQATHHRIAPVLTANPLAGSLIADEFNRAREQLLSSLLDQDPWALPLADYAQVIQEYVTGFAEIPGERE